MCCDGDGCVVWYCQVGGLQGDGYPDRGGQRDTSPHTRHETFSGVTVLRAAEVGEMKKSAPLPSGIRCWFVTYSAWLLCLLLFLMERLLPANLHLCSSKYNHCVHVQF